jgi:hypothetical protein
LLDGLAFVDFILHPLQGDITFGSPLFRIVHILILVPLNVLVGFLIIRRVPGNIVGPLLIVWSGTVAYKSVSDSIGLIPLSLYFAYDIMFGWLGLFLMFAHFPDGRIYHPGIRRWVHIFLAFQFSSLLTITSEDIIPSTANTPNPFYLPAVQAFYAGPFFTIVLIYFSLTLVLMLLSQVARYRSGSYIERQQMKWLALFMGAILTYSIIFLVTIPLLTATKVMHPGANAIGMFFFFICGLFPPLAIGIAILRHHLWDIDRIIRRTLVYTALTLIISFMYFGIVLVLQSVLTAIIGHTHEIAIVLSTLTIAALFTPLRRRVQDFIDHRFYRARYNAEQIITTFASTARNEVALEPLTAALLTAVEDTLRPENMSLWLRPTPEHRRESQ